MKYMLMTFGDETSWDWDQWPREKVEDHFRNMSAFLEELQGTSELVTGEGLTPPSHALTVELRDGRPVASDGPYAESKEVLAGFLIVETESHDRALELAGRFAGLVESRVELRPVDEAAGPDYI
ncbi:YciI family protein [Microlunatus sp. GCM10028923]|uniref:YciI family protein n=1 Tax=Microlunatus sp. GCM10028923 TaxID=3273400 RepID=UPI00360693BF